MIKTKAVKVTQRVQLHLDEVKPWVTISWDDEPVWRMVCQSHDSARAWAAVVRTKLYPSGHKKARFRTDETLLVTKPGGRFRITKGDKPLPSHYSIRILVTEEKV